MSPIEYTCIYICSRLYEKSKKANTAAGLAAVVGTLAGGRHQTGAENGFWAGGGA